jgi:uncharacterized membrane protein YkoI
MTRKVALLVALVLAVGAIVAGIAIAAAGGDEQPLTGAALEKATAAALQNTGGGTVSETEVGDGGAAYEVEVRLADGSQVEVQLDEAFRVIGREADDDGAADDTDGDD